MRSNIKINFSPAPNWTERTELNELMTPHVIKGNTCGQYVFIRQTHTYIESCLSIEIYYIAVAYYLGSAVRWKKEEEQVVDADDEEEDEEKAYKVIGFLFGRYKFKLNVENVKLPHTKMVCV